ncbi:tRNA pseudouridine(38-40) synthase TruA [cyanobacterium TDX16]|nr:tRNA pseudouridine(38-40) synthase TruA [cyanobacterium TDX16]
MRTVGGELVAAVEKVLGVPVELACAGRTDAGVHASGQVISFAVPGDADLARLQQSVNRMLGPEVVLREVEQAPWDFDARFSARARAYRYTVLNRPVPDPFLAATSWFVPEPLELRAMRAACDPLIGEHDFSSFCRRPKPGPRTPPDEQVSLVRRVLSAEWVDLGDDVLRFDVEATSFCHQMVRSLVAVLVDAGRGRRTPADVMALLRAKDRAGAASPAPPEGLNLWHVTY